MGERWQRFRRWIDNEKEEHRLEEIIQHAKPGSPSMKFIVRIVDAIKTDLVSGGAYIPSTENSPAYFPPIYYVFISESDSKEWTGSRLTDLQTKVAEGVMRKVAELDRSTTTQTIRIDVRTDATLNAGQIKVQSRNQFTKTADEAQTPIELRPTKKSKGKRPILYQLEVWHRDEKQEVRDVTEKEIEIGRGPDANVKLIDEEIGRTHANLLFENKELYVISMNENPTSVGEEILEIGKRRKLSDSDEIRICDFTLIPRLRSSASEFKANIGLSELIKQRENKSLEFKSTLRWNVREGIVDKKMEEIVLKTISAFANTDGGKLLIGVGDSGEVIGLEFDYQTLKHGSKDGFELHLRNLVSAAFGRQFASHIDIQFPIIDGKEICEVDVRRGEVPLYYAVTDKVSGKIKKFYIRSGNSSQELDIQEATSYIKSRF